MLEVKFDHMINQNRGHCLGVNVGLMNAKDLAYDIEKPNIVLHLLP